ncbi:hypothetical protein [Mycobacterium sp. AT1]|uniref:hypothetical protein n=1 Tax=Mycobacterium sp. AT1 TaxID=1961706 RepID=UPI001E3DD8C6|nr:hypothetical protein [Mycobacterium sp. AT1]
MKPTPYRILIRGQLSERLAAAFDGMVLRVGDGETELTGLIRDQSELYGLLDRVRSLGLDLISAYPMVTTDGDGVP